MSFGSMVMKKKHNTLPPLSTDGCTMTNNLTFHNYNGSDSSSIVDFLDEFSPSEMKNQTIGVTSLCRYIFTVFSAFASDLFVAVNCLLINIH